MKNYEAIDFFEKNLHHLNRLRDLLRFIVPTTYRGTGRTHFDGSPFWMDAEGNFTNWPNSNLADYDNLEARKLFATYENANTFQDTNTYLCFFTLEEMQNVYKLIDNKTDFEILEIIENEQFTTEKTIGFDVGYIGGDFFSAIADTAIKPMWHPPDFYDMNDIIEHLKKLNNSCLFNNFDDARKYRQTYLTKEWAEKEMYEGQITIIQIRAI